MRRKMIKSSNYITKWEEKWLNQVIISLNEKRND